MWNEVLEPEDDADLTHRRVFWRGLTEAPALDQHCPHSEKLLVLNTPLREDHGLTMTEIPAGLQTMSSLSLALSPEQLWPPCPLTYTHRPLTQNGTSPCGKHAIQISGLYRSPVRPSDWVSGALLFQIALMKNMCCVQGPRINLSYLNSLTLVSCFLQKTSCLTSNSNDSDTNIICKCSRITSKWHTLMFSTFCLSFCLHSFLTMDYEEDYEDVTVNQMLAPKSQDTHTTKILNTLLKDYDNKLRPDIGGKWFFCSPHGGNKLEMNDAHW